MRSDAPTTACACLLAIACAGRAGRPAEVVEEVRLYPARGARARASVWGMSHEQRRGDLLLNGNHEARPWAGVAFKPTKQGEAVATVTPAWVANGCVRFLLVRGHDAYGQLASPCPFQVLLGGCMTRYLRIPERFYLPVREGEAGPAGPPQEVLVPLKHLGVKPGARVETVSLQCVGKPRSAFAIRDAALVRFHAPFYGDAGQAGPGIAPSAATWPAYDELPEAWRPEHNQPLLRDGKLVTKDGRRTFLLMPWCREDQRLNLGVSAEGKTCPDWKLYDRERHGFIYERSLDARSMARLGFNCYAGQVHPGAFWDAVGYKGRPWGSFTHEAFVEHVRAMRYPFYVDMVCFPWTLGRPADDKKAGLPPGMLHNGNRHWTPYRIVGKGREVWLTMWRTYARRYKEAGARVIFYELMNEPAYAATTADHRGEFVQWLRRRHGTLARVNAAWGTRYASWEEIEQFKTVRDCTGVFFDYDEYLAERFADLVRAGRDAVEQITPGVPAAIQTMSGYTLRPSHAVHLSKLIPVERAVLAPTGGGRWTEAIATLAPGRHTIDQAVGPSPIANDLLLAMAGEKMIVDNELYLGRGQTRAAMRNRLWRAVVAGLDGAAWFSWSKRGWAWWRGVGNIRREADLFPYSNLIPLARRPEAIRGVLDFAKEIELVREFVLPKPWGPRAKVGMLYSWANARWAAWEPTWRDRTGNVHAAMRALHWTFDMVPSHLATPERLARYELLVAGSIDHVEPELVERLAAFARGGGSLIVADSLMGHDLYGKPVDASALLGVRVKGKVRVRAGEFALSGLPELPWLPGNVDRAAARLDVEPLPPTEVLWSDTQGRPVVTRRRHGQGEVHVVAADLRGYPLAKLLALIRRRAASPPSLLITDAGSGELAPGVLASRRAHASHQALLLLNTDERAKTLRLRLADLEGAWHLSDPLEGTAYPAPRGTAAWPAAELATTGVRYALPPGSRGLLLLTRQPWRKTELTRATAP